MNYFEHFSPEHIGMLLSIVTVITLSLVFVRKTDDKKADTILKVSSVMLFSLELIQDIFLLREGIDPMTILPLHLCNIGIFVNLLACFTKGRIQGYFAEISLVLNMPGAIGALIFPNWTFRPFLSFTSIMCFATHMFLTFIPLALLLRRKIDAKFSHYWYGLLFMAAVSGPIYYLDIKRNVNYMFLLSPVEGSPLELIYDLSGGRYYIPGLIVLLMSVLFFEYLLITVIRSLRSRHQQRSVT